MFGHVLVVGAGQMGGGIAQVVAASGRRVSLYDAAPGAVERGRRDDAAEPRQARREGWGGPGRGARSSRARRGSRPGRPDDRGGRRGRGGEGGRLPPRGRAPARRGGPRLEHVVDPDLDPRRRNGPTRPGDRHALLQPGAGDVARRGRPRPGDLRRDGRGDHRARARAREDAGGRERLPGLRLEPDPDAVHQRGRLGAARGRGRARRRSTRSRSSGSPTRWARSRSPT